MNEARCPGFKMMCARSWPGRRCDSRPRTRRFVRMARAQHVPVGEAPPDYLHADRRGTRLDRTRHRRNRMTGEVERIRQKPAEQRIDRAAFDGRGRTLANRKRNHRHPWWQQRNGHTAAGLPRGLLFLVVCHTQPLLKAQNSQIVSIPTSRNKLATDTTSDSQPQRLCHIYKGSLLPTEKTSIQAKHRPERQQAS